MSSSTASLEVWYEMAGSLLGVRPLHYLFLFTTLAFSPAMAYQLIIKMISEWYTYGHTSLLTKLKNEIKKYFCGDAE